MKNPFIPSRSTVCLLAEWVMIFALILAGLAAGLSVLFRRVVS